MSRDCAAWYGLASSKSKVHIGDEPILSRFFKTSGLNCHTTKGSHAARAVSVADTRSAG